MIGDYKLLMLPYGSVHPFAGMFKDVGIVQINSETDGRYPFEPDKRTIIMYGGGTDVSPSLYGSEPHSKTDVSDRRRDIFESNFFSKYKDKVAGFIGICRGSQFLTVMNKGRLIQHLPGLPHCGNHLTLFEAPNKTRHEINVTSTHHQMMYPFDLPKECYKLVAWAKPKLCASYEFDNKTSVKDIEAEPEVVWYPKTRSLCIQGHPEYLSDLHPYPAMCRNLLRHYLFVS